MPAGRAPGGGGLMLLIAGYRAAQVAVMAPFQYSQMPFALLAGLTAVRRPARAHGAGTVRRSSPPAASTSSIARWCAPRAGSSPLRRARRRRQHPAPSPLSGVAGRESRASEGVATRLPISSTRRAARSTRAAFRRTGARSSSMMGSSTSAGTPLAEQQVHGARRDLLLASSSSSSSSSSSPWQLVCELDVAGIEHLELRLHARRLDPHGHRRHALRRVDHHGCAEPHGVEVERADVWPQLDDMGDPLLRQQQVGTGGGDFGIVLARQEAAARPGGEVDDQVDAACPDPLDHLAIERELHGRRAGLRVVHGCGRSRHRHPPPRSRHPRSAPA